LISGIYILQIILETNKNISFGRYHNHFFQRCTYFYVGSALNGLDARIQRHLSPDKKMHWHIDYLLRHTRIQHIYIKKTTKKEECFYAQKLAKEFTIVPDFGASDCKYISHLFYTKNQKMSGFFSKLDLIEYPNSAKN
jgi:Uri superfamily endonuclease